MCHPVMNLVAAISMAVVWHPTLANATLAMLGIDARPYVSAVVWASVQVTLQRDYSSAVIAGRTQR